jgi:hypothetical protein
MSRALPVCAVLLALPPLCRADQKPAPTETIIRLTVQPMAAPKPALKYQLLPELREMSPGNPIQGYLKCFMEQNHFFFDKKSMEDRDKWGEMPLKDLPVKELRHYGGQALRLADDAARLDSPDWQILLKLKRDGFATLLPDVQQMRTLGWALKIRLRGEVADRRFDDAVTTAQTIFALSRHLGEHPILIADLVGIAVAYQAIEPLDEMVAQPGSPNLFWALADLPHPFIDLRKGIQGERLILANEAAILDERAPMTEAQLRKVMERFYILLQMVGRPKPGVEKALAQWVGARLTDMQYVAAARQRLIEHGLAKDAVGRFPPLQVILLDRKRAFEIRRDDVLKTIALPYWQGEAVRAAHPLDQAIEEKMLDFLLQGFWRVRQAQARLEQRLALLRCVEALRLYAAAHAGKLPAKLSDMKLPLPIDPVTGKAFPYTLEGGTAILRATPPPGQERNAGFNVRYEVSIGKATDQGAERQ